MRLTDYSVVLVCTSGVLLGCAPAARTPAGSSVAQPMAQSMIASPLAQAGSSTPTAADLGRLLPTGISTASDDDALTKLWHTRTQSETLDDYPLGAGDVLQISVPNLDEIQTFGARISGEGTITLPLVGLIHAANLTEEQLRQEIRQRLEAKYMRDPQVNVFVQEYRSRQVA
ncbi:MAG: polysaccharide biosynthesis/export family protein, partial [Candidatus Binatia bacterium]